MSWLVSVSVRRPVAVSAFYVLVAFLAIVSYVRLPVSLLPPLRFPTLLVWTAFPDVGPDRVERAVTERVEDAVAGTAGLQRMTARSQLGGSLIRLDFGWGTDLDLAILEVREQLERLGDGLPAGAERPVVLRFDPSEGWIMMIALQAAVREAARGPEDLQQLKTLGREVVARRLEQLPGVARVAVTGGFDRQISVVVDAGRAHAYGIDLPAVVDALESANVSLTGGLVRRGPLRYAVEVAGELTNAAEIEALVVSPPGAVRVRLADLATVRETVAERRGLVRLDGSETLLLLVERRPDANTVRTALAARKVLRGVEAQMPDVRLNVVVDESRFIVDSLDGVRRAIVVGGLLALAVLFAFLRRIRAMVAVGVAVPLSLALTLVLFELFGISLNLISLSGLALGIGMLLDNAIVVAENVARLREAGLGPRQAARQGATEVAGAITASTLTTISVFVPLTFVEGLAGRLFRDQSLAIVCSLLASLLVALSAVPAIAAREPGTGTWSGLPGSKRYEAWLGASLRRRGLLLAGSLLLLSSAAWLGLRLPREIVPQTEQGRVEATLTVPADADLSLLGAQSRSIETAVRSWPGVTHVLADLGERDQAWLDLEARPPYRADLTLLLAPGTRSRTVFDQLRQLVLPAGSRLQVRVVRSQLEALLVADDNDLLIDLVADRRLEPIAEIGAAVAALAARPELVNVALDQQETVPTYHLSIDRQAVARFGLSPGTLGTYLEGAARGRQATALRTINEDVPIRVRLGDIGSLDELMAQTVTTGQGLLPIKTFVDVRRVEMPAALIRQDQSAITRIVADVAPGGDLVTAMRAVMEALKGNLPPTVRIEITGANQVFRDSLQAVVWSLVLSTFLVYLILAAQFESLLQPIIILAIVPLALAGVVVALAVSGQTLNLMSLIGGVVLVGIVVNDAIIKVDFINHCRRRGSSIGDAVRQAGAHRLRPILMTSVTTILGLMPLALGWGAGGELRSPLAIAIIGGLVTSTLLTLFVTPALYTALARWLGEPPAMP